LIEKVTFPVGERPSGRPDGQGAFTGSATRRFFAIEAGRLEFVDRKPGKDVYVAEAAAGMLALDAAGCPGRAVRLPRVDGVTYTHRCSRRPLSAHLAPKEYR